jgi:Flavodoxin domain
MLRVRDGVKLVAGDDQPSSEEGDEVSPIVVYESVYGNTRAIAQAIAEGLGATAVPVQEASGAADASLLVIGGPTHMHSLATARSRQMAVAAAHEDGGVEVERYAEQEPGLRSWLRELPPGEGRQFAAFDTRLDKSPWLTGMAARAITRRMRARGYALLSSDSFFVQDSEGPLEEGEIERARAWGEELARLLAPTDGQRASAGT